MKLPSINQSINQSSPNNSKPSFGAIIHSTDLPEFFKGPLGVAPIEGKVKRILEECTLTNLLEKLKAIKPDTWELNNYTFKTQQLSSTADPQLQYTFKNNSNLSIHFPNGDTTTISIDKKTLEEDKQFYHAVFNFFKDLVTDIINKPTKK